MSVEGSSGAGADPQRFTFDAPPGRVVFGAGAAHEALAGELERLDADRVLVISTPRGEALARELSGPLGDRVVGVFTGVRQHVPVETAQAARQLASELEANGVLCVGGGSAVGTAKAVALTSGLPILAVPTTYAGSEVTPVWGMTEAGRKTTGIDPIVQPRTVVYDPELTRSLPPTLAAVSGLNAMAHGIEAFWAPGRNPVSSAIAERSIRGLATGLPAVVDDPNDMAARTEVLLGAWLAGAAFAVAGSGLHHRICHVLGGAYGLPHAETHAIVLPHVLGFNAPEVPAAAARIAAALGGDDAVAGLVGLSARLGVPRGLRSIGLEWDALDDATELVLEKVPADNPRPADRDAIAALLAAAWSGPPDVG